MRTLIIIVEVILSKVDPLLLQRLYNIPPFDDIRDFLIKIALTRGRLGKVSYSPGAGSKEDLS